MDEVVYGVWVQLVFGQGSRKVPLLLEYFGSCRTIYESDDIERRLSGLLLPIEISKMEDTPLDAAVEIIEACHRLNYRIITPDSEDYPNRLRNIPDYPAALYISGVLPDIDDEVCIAMVGTRRASRYGYKVANDIAMGLSACGAVVVSGCARGIDTASHQGALMAGGRTLGVLGCGINTRYNMENDGLRNVISESGALISEYPPGAPPFSYHFPIRNRIISALSLGVIVVEAGAKSGSLITANLALEQGKDIFAVPGEINNYQAKGTNRLIFDGAKPIGNAYDVLEEYVVAYPHRLRLENLGSKNSIIYDNCVRPKWERENKAEKNDTAKKSDSDKSHVAELKKRSKPQPNEAQVRDLIVTQNPEKSHGTKTDEHAENEDKMRSKYPIGMSEGAVKVISALDSTPKSLDELIDQLSIGTSDMMTYITELELYGLVKSLPGKRYIKNT